MKISVEAEASGRFSLCAGVDAYDGVTPVSRFSVDYVPSAINPERVALAGYLAFGSWNSGELRFTEAICPELATAIEMDAVPVRVRPGQIDYAPKHLPGGEHVAQVVVGTAGHDSVMSRSIRILPKGMYQGALRREGHIQVASNAYIFAGCLPLELAHRPMLAVAVLLAEDFRIARLQLHTEVSEGERIRLQSMLGASGLALTASPR